MLFLAWITGPAEIMFGLKGIRSNSHMVCRALHFSVRKAMKITHLAIMQCIYS